jgi:hypothetical protein
MGVEGSPVLEIQITSEDSRIRAAGIRVLFTRVTSCDLLPDDGTHVVKSDGFAETNDLGADRDDLVSAIIDRAGKLVTDIDAHTASRDQNPEALVQ